MFLHAQLNPAIYIFQIPKFVKGFFIHCDKRTLYLQNLLVLATYCLTSGAFKQTSSHSFLRIIWHKKYNKCKRVIQGMQDPSLYKGKFLQCDKGGMKILKLKAWNFSSPPRSQFNFLGALPPSCWFWSIQIFGVPPSFFQSPPFGCLKIFRAPPPQYLHPPLSY